MGFEKQHLKRYLEIKRLTQTYELNIEKNGNYQ